MSTPKRMTDDEVMAELRSDTPLNRARAVFSGAWATLEQASMQRKPPGPIEIRRLEFEAVRKIKDALLATPAPDALVGDLVEALEATLKGYVSATKDAMRLDGEGDERKIATLMDDDHVAVRARAVLAKARAATPAATGKE